MWLETHQSQSDIACKICFIIQRKEAICEKKVVVSNPMCSSVLSQWSFIVIFKMKSFAAEKNENTKRSLNV